MPERFDSAAGQASGRNRWIALILLCLAQFMLILDITAVNVALPAIGTGLHLSREALTWVITAYSLCFGGLMILGGRLADALGARRVLMAGLVMFMTASAVTGLAGGTAVLITGRAAQGVGAAVMSPAALAVVTMLFPGAERGKALAVWGSLAGAGSALGSVFGGALTAGPGWRWIFYINLPVGAVVLIALPLLVAARPGRPAGLDAAGAILVTGGTAALIYGLVKAGDSGWGSGPALIPLGAAAVLYAAFALTERKIADPLIDVRMFARGQVLTGASLMLVATSLLFGFFFLGSLYLEHVRGWSALTTGLLFLPMAAAAGTGAQLAGRLTAAIGIRNVAVAGMGLAAIGSALLTRIGTTGSPWAGLLPGMVIGALGIGALFVTATGAALANVAEHEAGLASAVVNTSHEIGGGIGIAVLSTIAASGISHGAISGFTTAFTASAVVAAFAAGTSAVLIRGRTSPAGEGMGQASS